MAGIEPTTRPAAGTLPDQLLTAITAAAGPPGLYQTSLLQSLRQPATKPPATPVANSERQPVKGREQNSATSASAGRYGQSTGRTATERRSVESGSSAGSSTRQTDKKPTDDSGSPAAARNARTDSGTTASTSIDRRPETSEAVPSDSETPPSAGNPQDTARPSQEGGPPGSLTDSLNGSAARTTGTAEETDIAEDPVLEQLLDEISASLSAAAPQSQEDSSADGSGQVGEESLPGDAATADAAAAVQEAEEEDPDSAASLQTSAETQGPANRQQAPSDGAVSAGQPGHTTETAAITTPKIAGSIQGTRQAEEAPAEEGPVPTAGRPSAEEGTSQLETAAPGQSPDTASSTRVTPREQRTDRFAAENTSGEQGQGTLSTASGKSSSGQSSATGTISPAGAAAAPLPVVDGSSAAGTSTATTPAALTSSSSPTGGPAEPVSQPAGSRTQVNSASAAAVSTGEHTAGAATTETATAADSRQTALADRVAAAMKQMKPGGGQLRILLHPEHLGDLRIELLQKGGEVTARLEVQTAEAQQLLTEQLSQLQDSLSRRGMKIDSIQIELSTRKTGEPQEQQRQQESGQQQNRGRHSDQQQSSSRDQSGHHQQSPEGETASAEQPGAAAA